LGSIVCIAIPGLDPVFVEGPQKYTGELREFSQYPNNQIYNLTVGPVASDRRISGLWGKLANQMFGGDPPNIRYTIVSKPELMPRDNAEAEPGPAIC
jgi:hypothetical protein